MRHSLPCLLLALTARAPGQTLNLGGTATPPPAGSGTGALALADSLENQAASLRANAATRDRAKGVLRTVAAGMIRAGEDAGAAGSTRIVLGRTIADNLATLDHFIDYGPGEPTLELLIRDAEQTLGRLQSSEPACERGVRDLLALSMLAAAAPSGDFGWCGPPLSAPPEVRGELDQHLSAAQDWEAYTLPAMYLRDLVTRAALEPAIAWLDPAARDVLGRQFQEVQGALESPDSIDSAVVRLQRLARAADLVRAADALTAPSQPLARVRAALGQRLATAAADPAADLHALDGFGRVFTLIGARAGLPADTTLVRELRPAYRDLLQAARTSEMKLTEALPSVLAVQDAMTQPGLLSAVAAHHRVIEDLRLLVAASSAISRPRRQPSEEPQVTPAFEPLAVRLLAMCQQAARDDRRDAALPLLRDLLARLVRSHEPAALAALRTAAPGTSWGALTGDDPGALAGAFDTCRAAWLGAIARDDAPSAAREAARLDTLLDLIALLDDAARAHAARTPADILYARLQGWPGWQLSAPGVLAITDGLDVALSETTALTLQASPDEARDAMARVKARFGAALLAGRLIAISGGWRPVNPAHHAPLYEVCAGAPLEGWSWLAQHRAQIASVCRYAEELPVARSLGDGARARRLDDFINEQAARVLAALESGR